MHQQPNSFFSSVNLTTIVKKFCFLILGILGLARASYASNAHSFYYNEQAFEAAMVELSQLEKTVVANENLTLEGLQKLHPQLVKNLAAEPTVNALQQSNPPLGIPSFLWGCCFGFLGIALVYFVTEDSEQTKKALWGCITSGLVVGIFYLILFLGFTGSTYFGTF
jgi:hypothetical protein